MKKLLLTLTVVTVSALTMYGQGRVDFNNESTFAPVDAITVGAANQGSAGGAAGNGIGSPNYSVQLLWTLGTNLTQTAFNAAGPTASAVFGGTGVWFAPTGPLTSFSGLFEAGTVQIGPAAYYTMQTLAWYDTGGTSYAAASAAGLNFGRSALFLVNVTAAPGPINSTIFPGFQVGAVIVPEPSTFALAGLGAASLLLFRRRK